MMNLSNNISVHEQLSLFEKYSPEVIIPSDIHNHSKIDLHRHLLGSITAEMLLNVVKDYALPLPTHSLADLGNLLTIRAPVDGLRPYFRPWSTLSKLIISPDVLSALVYHVLRDAYKDNVVYTELRAGWGMTGKELFSVKDFLKGIREGLTRGQQEYGVMGRLVFGITRHLFARHTTLYRRQLWSKILDAVSQYKDSVVVGFDLSGIEERYPPRFFMEEFAQAREMGFPITIHCGETTGVEDIWEALEVAQPARISHALSSIEDTELLTYLATSRIPVEVCPTSNWLTQTVVDLAEHPMKKMYASGIKLTVNTDNPAISETTLSREYALLISKMKFSNLDIEQFIKNSIDSTFVNNSLRQTIQSTIFGGKGCQ